MKKILVIDDDVFTSGVYRSRLQRDGYEVETSATGEAGLESVRRRRPDLVLLDLQLPGESGVDVLRKLRSDPHARDLPVLVFTNGYRSELVDAAWNAGATDLFNKGSCTPHQMSEAIQKALQNFPAPAGTPVADDPSVVSSEGQFQARIPEWLDRLRAAAVKVVSGDGASVRKSGLQGMQQVLRGISGAAGLVDRSRLARLAGAMDAFCGHLSDRAELIAPAHLNTLDSGLDALEALLMEPVAVRSPRPSLPPQVLVVDDEVTARHLARAALDRFGIVPVCASDPSVALALCSDNAFALLVLDIDMPGMSGFDLGERISRLPSYARTPVIFVSRMGKNDGVVQSGLRDGQVLITKPYSPAELGLKAVIELSRTPPS